MIFNQTVENKPSRRPKELSKAGEGQIVQEVKQDP